MNKKPKNYRAWLGDANGPYKQSYVMVNFADGDFIFEDHHLILKDCRYTVQIEFPREEKYRKTALAKLDKIQKALDLLREQLEGDVP